MGIAAVMILVGLGIRMHADSKYTNKMYYHTPLSRLYTFDDVFAELKTGDNVMFLSVPQEGFGSPSWRSVETDAGGLTMRWSEPLTGKKIAEVKLESRRK